MKLNLKTFISVIVLVIVIGNMPATFSRNIREGDNFEVRVQQIFDEVVNVRRYENVHLPLAIRNVFARLLSYNIPGKGEDFIREKFCEQIEYEIQRLEESTPIEVAELKEEDRSRVQDAYRIVRSFYEDNKEFLGELKFPSEEDFIASLYGSALHEGDGGMGLGSVLSYHKKIILSGPLNTGVLVEGLFHLFLPGFTCQNELREGYIEVILQDYILREIADNFINLHPDEEKIVREIIEIVGEKAFLRAFAEQNYDILREFLGNEVIELFELSEVLILTLAKNPYFWYDIIGQAFVVPYIMGIRDSKEELMELKERMLEFLSEH